MQWKELAVTSWSFVKIKMMLGFALVLERKHKSSNATRYIIRRGFQFHRSCIFLVRRSDQHPAGGT